MRFFIDVFPVAVFFISYQLSHQNLFTATAAGIGASVLQLLFFILQRKPIDKMLWLSMGLMVILGGATLLFQDKRFIMWKPTILYWGLAATLLIAYYGTGRNFIRSILHAHITLPETAWLRLQQAWTVFFIAMGALNLWVAYSFEETFWVNFKLIGTPILLLIFGLAQGMWLSRWLNR